MLKLRPKTMSLQKKPWEKEAKRKKSSEILWQSACWKSLKQETHRQVGLSRKFWPDMSAGEEFRRSLKKSTKAIRNWKISSQKQNTKVQEKACLAPTTPNRLLLTPCIAYWKTSVLTAEIFWNRLAASETFSEDCRRRCARGQTFTV